MWATLQRHKSRRLRTELGKSRNKCVDVGLSLASGGLHVLRRPLVCNLCGYVFSASATSKPAGGLSCRPISCMCHTYLSMISLSSVSLSLYICVYTYTCGLPYTPHIFHICICSLIFANMYMYIYINTDKQMYVFICLRVCYTCIQTEREGGRETDREIESKRFDAITSIHKHMYTFIHRSGWERYSDTKEAPAN